MFFSENQICGPKSKSDGFLIKHANKKEAPVFAGCFAFFGGCLREFSET